MARDVYRHYFGEPGGPLPCHGCKCMAKPPQLASDQDDEMWSENGIES